MTAFQQFLDSLHTETTHGWIWGHVCRTLGISPERTNLLPADELVKHNTQWYVNRRGIRRMLAVAPGRLAQTWRERVMTEESESYKIFYDAKRYEDRILRDVENDKWEQRILDAFLIGHKEDHVGMAKWNWYTEQLRLIALSIMVNRAKRARLAREFGLAWAADDELEPIKHVVQRLEKRKAANLPLITSKSVDFDCKDSIFAKVEQCTTSYSEVYEAAKDKAVEATVNEFLVGNRGAEALDTSKASQRTGNRAQKMLDDDDEF